MNAFGVCSVARLIVVSGLATLAATGLAACSGSAPAATAGATSASITPTPSASSRVAPTTSATSASPQTTSSSSSTSSTRASQTTPGSAEATPTVVKTFLPFDPATGKPAIRLSSTRTGYCWFGSIALDAPNAYRCMAGNLILDPCFANPKAGGQFVVCVDAPWEAGTKLVLNRALPSSHNTGPAQPGWALQLANGSQCVALTGTIPFVHNVPMRYGCGASGGQAGNLRHSGTHWTVDYAPAHSSTLTRVRVATVWG